MTSGYGGSLTDRGAKGGVAGRLTEGAKAVEFAKAVELAEEGELAELDEGDGPEAPY
jgi:hypothetical protein